MAANDSLNTQIQALFNRLKERFTPDKTLTDAIAQHLQQSVMKNFAKQKWEPLKASTLKQKRRRGLSERILEATGNLKHSIKPGTTGSSVWVYTDAVYGAIHNFGGTIRVRKGRRQGIKEKIIKIPARPFLVLTEGFKERIMEEIRRQSR
jgi:phage virion morphogenesis protein